LAIEFLITKCPYRDNHTGPVESAVVIQTTPQFSRKMQTKPLHPIKRC